MIVRRMHTTETFLARRVPEIYKIVKLISSYPTQWGRGFKPVISDFKIYIHMKGFYTFFQTVKGVIWPKFD